MIRDLGQPIMSHDITEVSEQEILGDRPRKIGEVDIDLTSVGEVILASASSVNRGGLRIINSAVSFLRGAISHDNSGEVEYPAPTLLRTVRSFGLLAMLKSLRARAS